MPPARTVPLDALLPSNLPVVDGLRVSASYVPGGDGGGDFYDAFFLDDDTLAIAIGDAGAHGVAAIAAMNVVRQAIRNALIDGAQPVDVLRRANRALVRSDVAGIVTAFVGIVDPATLLLRYALAGHPAPLLATDDREANALHAGGTTIALGVMPHHVATEMRVTLPVDGLLACYTDGCVAFATDAENGTEIFSEVLAQARVLKPSKPAVAIDRAIFRTRERTDDATILTVTPEPTLAHIDVHLPAEPSSAPLARGALRRFFAGTSLDERRTYDALVATGEAISNAIEHAYAGRPHHSFTVSARSESDACLIFVEDSGNWRDDGEADGRGLGMMRQLSDDCVIERSERGTRVILRFALAASIADVALHAT